MGVLTAAVTGRLEGVVSHEVGHLAAQRLPGFLVVTEVLSSEDAARGRPV